jgi:uncharacterized protein YrzB (UPF0473 family)
MDEYNRMYPAVKPEGDTAAASLRAPGASTAAPGQLRPVAAPKGSAAAAAEQGATATGRLAGGAGLRGGTGSQAAGEFAATSGGNLKTAAAKISYDVTKPKPLAGWWDNLRSHMVDRFAHLETAEKKILGKIPAADTSAYKQARLFAGVPERANVIIQKELNPIIKRIEATGKSYKDLGLYSVAIHAKDVNAKGLVSGFTNAEIDDVIRQLGTSEMEAARKELVAYSNRRLDALAASGRISKEAVDAMRAKWPNYIPLSRVMDEAGAGFAKNLSESFASVANPIKALKGSERTIIDPVESLMKNTYLLENAAGEAEVAKRIGMLADQDGSFKFFKKLTDAEAEGKRYVVKSYENGKEIKFETTKELYDEISGLTKEHTNMLIKILSKPASVLRAGATLTPEFAVRNPFRDLYNAWFVSDVGYNPISDFAVGLASSMKKGKLYEQFVREKGGLGNIVSMDRSLYRESIAAAIKQPVTKKFVTVVNPKSWIKLMRKISDATESATKVGVYRASLRKGLSPAEAAYQARDIMDFARAGSSVQPANRVIAFLNSNIQGKSKLIRAIKEHPVKMMVKIATGMTLPSIGTFAFNEMFANETQKKTITDSPAWLRDTYWLIAIPGTDLVARIPKPFELSAFANVTERFLDYAIKNDKDAFKNYWFELFSNQAFSIMPTAATPLIEGITNYSFFRETPIVPQREQGIELGSQYDSSTSETAKLFAAGMRAVTGEQGPLKNFGSPRIADATIRSATGGLGGYALDAIDWLLESAGIVDKKNVPAKNISQQPLLKAFLVSEGQTGKAMDFVYTERDKLTREKGTFKKNNTTGIYPGEGKLKYLTVVSDAIGEMSKEIRTITEAADITPEQKRQQINNLKEQRNEIARIAQSKYASGDSFSVDGNAAVFNMVLTGKNSETKEEKTIILTSSQYDTYQREFQAAIKKKLDAKKQTWALFPPTVEEKQKDIDNLIEKVREEMKHKILWHSK